MRELFTCAMDIGEQMLISGAEVHRVEDSIKRMCGSFGAERADVFIITSSMVVTLYAPNGVFYTETRRITSSGTDFERLHRLNELSREICSEKLSAAEIRRRLEKACSCKKYPFAVECLCYSAVAGAFTLFFGGGLFETLVSLFIGLLMRFVLLLAEKVTANRIFSNFFTTATATALAFTALSLKLIPSVDNVIIGNIMTMIPGIGMTNALRDLLIGDSIAGLLRLTEAILNAIAIAAGYFAVAMLRGILS